MSRYSYDENIKPNWFIDNHINQRIENLKQGIEQFDDLLELYQILLYVDKTKKFDHQNTYKSNLVVNKSVLYSLINKYDEQYTIEYIYKWLEHVAKNKKDYFVRSQYGFWKFLYEYKKNITPIIEKYFALFIPSGIFLNKNILKKYFDKISELMIKNPESLESYYRNFDKIQEFSNNLYKKGKKEKIIRKYLTLSDLDLNILEDICNDPHISPNELTKVDLINIAKEKYNIIIQYYQKNQGGIKNSNMGGYIVCIGDEKPKSDNPLDCVLFLNRKYLESQLSSQQILNVLSKNIGLVDDNYIFSVLTNKKNGLASILLRKKYPGKTFYYSDYFYKDIGIYLIFKEYVLFLKKHQIYMLDVLNDFLGKYVPQKYKIYNFRDINFERKETSKDNIREIIEKMDIIFKYFNVFTQEEWHSINIVDQLKVPRINNIKSLITKKYVYVNDDYILKLWSEMKNNEYVFRNLVNNNYSVNTLESYEYTNMRMIFESGILYVDDDKVRIGDENLFKILNQLCRYGYIVYHGLNENQQAIVDDWIRDGKVNVYNRLFSKIEADYLNYYLNDIFINGPKLRNKYVHGATNMFTEKQHANNEIVFIYILTMIIFKLNEEFAYFKKYY